MNTEPNTHEYAEKLFGALNKMTLRLPKRQVVSELQAVVERVTFAGLGNDSGNSNDELTQIDVLLSDEVSPEIMGFVRWLAQQNALATIVGQPGRLFLSYCIERYEKIKEIKFMTPVELPSDMQDSIAIKLQYKHSTPARVVYEVVPSLVAGFVIDNGRSVVDRSLRSHMIANIAPHLAETAKEGAA